MKREKERKQERKKPEKGKGKIDLHQFGEGAYFVSIKEESGKVFNFKVVVSK